MKIILLRVGIDTAEGGFHSALFADGGFEFIRIRDDKHGIDRRTYGNTVGRHGRRLVEYFPARARERMAKKPMHVDPEFDTFTYGDPTKPKMSLAELKPGHLLVFYAGLKGWRFDAPPALYLVGFFEVGLAGVASSFSRSVIRRKFGRNFHVMHRKVLAGQRDDLVLIKGSNRSRLFKKAHYLGKRERLARGAWWQIISPRMAGIFSRFGGIGSLQRSTPRQVEATHISRAERFVKSLH